MSDNALVPMANLDVSALPVPYTGTQSQFDESTKGGNNNFTRRIQLSSKGKEVGDKYIKAGHWFIPISESDCEDLGPSIDVLPLAMKDKAIDFSDRPIVVSTDPQSVEFQRIKAAANAKDSNCAYGLSFLVWERSTNDRYEIFFGGTTSRPEGKRLRPYCPVTPAFIEQLASEGVDVSGMEAHPPLAATLRTKKAQNKHGSWFIPVVFDCSTPFSTVPETSQLAKYMTEFLSDDDVVTVEDSSVAQRAR